MSASHTPGPWQAHHDHGWLVVESRCGNLYIKVEKGSAARTHMADASLIAAAPDLLAALGQAVDAYCSLANSGDAGFWDPEALPEVRQARAAIAKAEGRS